MADAVVKVIELEPYFKAGLPLIPLHSWDAIDREGKQIGKAPLETNWRSRNYTPDQILKYIYNGCNIGVKIPPNYIIMDVDPRNFPGSKPHLFEEFISTFKINVDAFACVITGNGKHYYMRKPYDLAFANEHPAFPGIEFKGYGRQVVSAGSKHPSNKYYTWDDWSPSLISTGDIPLNLAEAITKRSILVQADTTTLDLTPPQLEEQLLYLNPVNFRDYDKWLHLMMACHYATHGLGLEEFIAWSILDEQYADAEKVIRSKWEGLRLEGPATTVTTGTLYKAVIDAGGTIPSMAAKPEEDFPEVEEQHSAIKAEENSILAELSAANNTVALAINNALKIASATGVSWLETLITELNRQHCVVNDGGRFRVYTEEKDPVLGRDYYSKSYKGDFEDLYSNILIECGESTAGQPKFLPVGKWWINHPQRRQYRGVIFDPEGDYPGWLNLWRGWGVEPKPGDWSLLKTLVKDVLCDGDQQSFDYVMNWMRNMVQHPSSPAEVAVFFKGCKGSGKGTLGRALVNIAGKHGLHISTPGHLTGRFNLHLKDTILLFADEAFWAGDRAGESVLKQLVTEPTLTYEGKGTNAETGRNLIHIMGASNSDWVIPAGLDGERRFAICNVNNSAVGDIARFKAINDQLYKEGGINAMLYDLLGAKTMWHPREGIPKNEALVQQQLRSMNELEEWWYETLCTGYLENLQSYEPDANWEIAPMFIFKQHFRENFYAYTRNRNIRSRTYSETQIGQGFAKLCPSAEVLTRTPRDTDIGVKVNSTKRASIYNIPPLKVCRRLFEKCLGQRLTWQ